MSAEASWNALSAKEKTASESFMRNEERVATGFMSMVSEARSVWHEPGLSSSELCCSFILFCRLEKHWV